MNNLIVCILLFCCVMKVVADTTVDDDGGFVVVYPASAVRSIQDADSAMGPLKEITASCTTSTGLYSVIYWDFPSERSVTNLQGFYQETLTGTIKSQNLQLISQAECKTEDIVGLDYIASNAGATATLHGRMFLVGHRYYLVTYVGNTGNENSKTALDYLNSFRLLR